MTAMKSLILGIASLCFLLGSVKAADEPVSLERTLVRAAPDVLKYCKEKGYKNVGVLKFMAIKDGKLSDNLGTLNRSVARRLEMGMILANDVKAPIGIIEDASEVAAKIPGANHLTKEGRPKLFEAKYPLAWGTDKVEPDAFITGNIGISEDLKTIDITLIAFDRAKATLVPIGVALTALNDSRKLSEIGESFTRGAFDEGKIETKKQEQQIVAKAAQVKTQDAKNPANDPTSPVTLEIRYDGKLIPIEVREGKAFIQEAQEGQKVTFLLKRNTEKGTLACVLKVNGENTLFRQKLPDQNCRKWLLFPEEKTGIEVIGFQKNDTTTEQFKVLSRADSKAREIDYGNDVGTITLSVFGEQKGTPPAGDLTEETEKTKAVERAQLPEKKSNNFEALTAKMLEEGNRGPGGLIAQGASVGKTINVVKFTADPTPLMSLTIVYYKK